MLTPAVRDRAASLENTPATALHQPSNSAAPRCIRPIHESGPPPMMPIRSGRPKRSRNPAMCSSVVEYPIMPLNLLSSMRPWSRATMVRDAIAGVSLASMNVPQVLGYTRIAGTPVVTGLYTLLLPLVAFAIFGSSRHLVVAADSATAAIFSSSLSRVAVPASEQYMALVCVVALLSAGLLLVARIFKLGFLADFLSRTVLTGFLAGVGLQVCIAMLSDMFGVAANSRYSLARAWQILDGLPHLHYPTLALSTLVAGSILLGNRFAPRLPLSLIAVVAAIAASIAFGFAERGIALVGPIAAGLPPIRLPKVALSEILELLPVSVSCVVMIIGQSAATSR